MNFTLDDVIKYLASENQLVSVDGNANTLVELAGFCSLRRPQQNKVLWTRGANGLETLRNCVLIAPSECELGSLGDDVVIVRVQHPRLAFLKCLGRFSTPTKLSGIDPTAKVSAKAIIGHAVYIGPYAFISDDVVIGDGSVIHGHVYICCPTKIGKNCIVHAGTVIGADGFGYERLETGELIKFPHVGGVEIGDNVEIGANVCIDRGALDDTVIHAGAKIDNLCHIAHNVEIGENSLVIALAMLGGSVRVGRNAWIAPGAIVREGKSIGGGATVGLGAVVTKDVAENDVVAGVPAKSMRAG